MPQTPNNRKPNNNKKHYHMRTVDFSNYTSCLELLLTKKK